MSKVVAPTRIVKTRDSANAILKKIGIPAVEYTMFIEKRPNGFEVFTEEAEQAVAKTNEQAQDAKALSAKVKVKIPEAKFDPAKSMTKNKDQKKMPESEYPTLPTKKTAKTPKSQTLVQKAANKFHGAEKAREAKANKPKVDKAPGIYTVSDRTVGTSSPSAMFRKCIIDGMTNDETLDAVAKQFRWDDEEKAKRKGFAGWYRMDCRRKNLIPNITLKGEVGKATPGYHRCKTEVVMGA